MRIVGLGAPPDRATMGGKGASLAELRRAGLPVPDARILTTAAWEELRASLALPSPLAVPVDELPFLRARILGAELPGGMEAEIAAAAAELLAGGGVLAVRSSGVSEDAEGASFAGLYETVLGVASAEGAREAVKRCLASPYHERVATYARSRGTRAHEMGMAVVLQRLVEAEVSGVLFTLNPVTGREREVLVEAVLGLGELLVSGRSPADRYVVDVVTGAALSVEIAAKRVALRGSASGGTREEQVAEPAASAPALSAPELRELAELAAAVQEHAGRPMDVEWVRAGGAFWLVQSRPVTAIGFDAEIGEWTTADFKDGGVSSDVCSPFMWSLYELALEASMPGYFEEIRLLARGSTTKWGTMFFARPYWNLGAVKEVLERIPGYVERTFDLDLGIAVPYEGEGRTTPVTLVGILRALPTLFALKRSYRTRLERNARFVAAFEARKAPYEIDDDGLAALPAPRFAELFRRLVTDLYFETETSYFTTIYNTSNSKLDFKVHFDRANRAAGGALSYLKMVVGLENLSHLRPMKDMHDRLAELRARNGAVDDELVRSFAWRWRHHGRRELDIRVPRWADDLPFVRAMLEQALATSSPGSDPEAQARAQRVAHEHERQRALEALFARPLARRSFAKGLALVRSYAWWREEMRDHSSYVYYLVRRFTVAASRRLVQRGLLATEDDVWYLTHQDVMAALEGALAPADARSRARAGRRLVRSFRNFRNPPEVRGRRDAAAPPAAAAGGALLRGTGCSPGRAAGIARVLRAPEEMGRLRPGEVLVAEFTDPGWTPLFAIAGAVVTECGGLLSHAALVSREYGLPAVLAVADATKRIRDGDLVAVDGSAGTVEILGDGTAG